MIDDLALFSTASSPGHFVNLSLSDLAFYYVRILLYFL